ncbi:MAG: helix-turn-helix domain-containing protein [Nitrospirae bacterium]|nr:helix-turn-helix domain-containing protein [Nitrospirota bacterium]
MESYFTKEQLAKYLKMNAAAVDRLVEKGQLAGIMTPKKIVIFKKSEVDAWLAEKKKKINTMMESEEIL